MFRSMMLVCALGALGAVGCVGTSDAADEASTSQNTGSGGLFDCQNNGNIGAVCTGDISILNGLTVNIDKTLDGNQLSVLSNDLNNLKITDINILDGNNILDDVKVVALNDVLTKFSIPVTAQDINVCGLVSVLGLGLVQVCK